MTGNTGRNTIKAGAGNDEINGGYGNDRLYGSARAGRVRVQHQARHVNNSDRTVNLDTTGDFSVKDDTLQLDNAVFKKLGKAGKLNKAYFTIGEQGEGQERLRRLQQEDGHSLLRCGRLRLRKAVEFAKLAKNLEADLRRLLHDLTSCGQVPWCEAPGHLFT